MTKSKKEKKKGNFSKAIVVFCVVEMMLMQAWAMWIADRNTYSTDSLIVANHAVFGGELLLLCLKRLLTKEQNEDETKNIVEKITKKKLSKDIENTDDENI
jgi:hypothetical protein